MPSLAIGGDHRDNLQWGDADFLADGHCPDRRAGPSLERLDEAARFAGQLDARLLAEAEIANVF